MVTQPSIVPLWVMWLHLVPCDIPETRIPQCVIERHFFRTSFTNYQFPSYHPQSNFPYQTLFINQQRSNKNNPQTSWKTSSLNELSRKTSRKLLSGTHGPCLVRICSPPTLLRNAGESVFNRQMSNSSTNAYFTSASRRNKPTKTKKKTFVLINKLLFLSFFFSFGGKFSRKTQSHRATSTYLCAIWCPVLLPWWQKKTERKNEHGIKVIRRTDFPRTAGARKVCLPVVTSRVTLR